MIYFEQTTIGPFEINMDLENKQLTHITFRKDDPTNAKKTAQMLPEAEKMICTIVSQLQEYINGTRKDFNLDSYLSWLQNESTSTISRQQGTTFQKKVWRALLTIPYGCIVSYSKVAEKIKHPHSVRAVANAIADNPILLVIPCHRVIRKNGQLSGFSAGPALKRQLLQLEQSVIA